MLHQYALSAFLRLFHSNHLITFRCEPEGQLHHINGLYAIRCKNIGVYRIRGIIPLGTIADRFILLYHLNNTVCYGYSVILKGNYITDRKLCRVLWNAGEDE